MDQVIRKYPPQDRQKGANMNAFALTGKHDWADAKGPCCGVLACAIATQTKFADAWWWFRKTYNKTARWKGTTYTAWYDKFLDRHNVNYKKLNPGKFGEIWFKRPLTYFARAKAKPDTAYLITTTGHAQVLYNDMVVDQRGAVPINEYWGKLKKVDSAIEIIVDKPIYEALKNINHIEFGLPLFDAANKKGY